MMISAGTDGMVSWTWHYIKVWLHLLQPATISSLSIRQSRHQSVMFDLTGVSWGRLGETKRRCAMVALWPGFTLLVDCVCWTIKKGHLLEPV